MISRWGLGLELGVGGFGFAGGFGIDPELFKLFSVM